MKVIFLDIDGVLNSGAYNKQCWEERAPGLGSPMGHVDPRAVVKLADLVRGSGARIVISSTWRILDDFADIVAWLRRHGLGPVGHFLGITPNHGGKMQGTSNGHLRGERGLEIQAWLDRWTDELPAMGEQYRKMAFFHTPGFGKCGSGAQCAWYPQEVESFVILDDDSDMAHLEDRLVQTDFEVGLKQVHVDRALEVLAKPRDVQGR